MIVTLILEGGPAEFDQLARRIRNALGADVRRVELVEEEPDPRSLTTRDPRRYQYTGAVSDYGTRECVDVRTGRRGVMGPCGFEPGAYVTRDGRVGYEFADDNPLRGLAGCFS